MTKRDYDFWFDYITSGIDDDMQDLREYLQSFDAHLKRKREDFDCRVAEYHADSADDEYGNYAEQLMETDLQLDVFERLLRNSTLASIVTYFELQVVKLTRMDFAYRKKADYPSTAELEAAAKQAARRFENLTAYWNENNLTFHRDARWNEISLIGKVRNKIAHTNGELGDDDVSNAVRAYVASRERAGKTGLKIDGDTIIVEPEYCLEVIDVYRGFLMDVMRAALQAKRS